jgi:hypothetical protein
MDAGIPLSSGSTHRAGPGRRRAAEGGASEDGWVQSARTAACLTSKLHVLMRRACCAARPDPVRFAAKRTLAAAGAAASPSWAPTDSMGRKRRRSGAPIADLDSPSLYRSERSGPRVNRLEYTV